MTSSTASINWFRRVISYDACFGYRLPPSQAVVPVRLQQFLRWPAGKARPEGYTFNITEDTAGPLFALGVGHPCAAAGYHLDTACSSVVYPHVLVSYDGGYSWSCLSETILPVARLHAGYAVYSASESGTEAARASSCELLCVVGGQDGSPGPAYGQPLRDVFCTRDGGRGSIANPLPVDVVGASAFVFEDALYVVGGIRSSGPYGALRAPIDPGSCALSGPWEAVLEESSQSSAWLHNSTLLSPVSFPDLRLHGWNGSCAPWCLPGIGTAPVSFVSLGILPVPQPSPSTYSLAPFLSVRARGYMAFTKDPFIWRPTRALPQSTLESGSPQRIFRLRGPLSLPLSTVSSVGPEGGLHRRVMVAAAGGSMYSSDDDGNSWSELGANTGSRNSSLPAPSATLPGPFLLGVGQDLGHGSAPTLLAYDPTTNATYIGYTRQCVVDCSQVGVTSSYMTTPCVDSPWTPPTCLPCRTCDPAISLVLLPCTATSNTVCGPINTPVPIASPTPVPGPAVAPPGLTGALDGSPWVEPLLYTSLLALWLLFVWASGGGRVLAARGMGEQKGSTVKKAIAPWWSNFAQHPSAATPLFVGLVASLAYRLIDLSLVLAALRLPGIREGARQALAAAGLLGLVASSAGFALAAVRINAGRKSWLKSRGAWVRGMRALGQAPDPPMRREEDRLTVEEDKRVQLLQSASTAFTLHPLSCLWLDVHLGRAVTMAQATSRALALASMGQSDGGDSTAGSAGQWGSSDSLRTAPLSPAWAVSQVLCSDAVHVFTCMIGAGATLGQGGGWAGAYAGLGVLPLCCALLAAWAFIPVYSAQAKRSLPRTASATTVASSTYNPISQQTEALHAHLERARLPSTGMSTGLNPVLGSSSGAPSRVVQHAAAGQGVLEGAGSMTSDPGPTSYTPHLPLPLLYTAGTLSYAPYPAGVAVPPTEVDAQSSIAGHSSQLSQHIITATGARYMGPYNHYTLEGLDERETVEGTRESTDQDAGLLQRALAAHAARAAVPPPAQAAAAPEPAQVVPAHTDEWQQLTGVLQRGSTTTGRVESPRAVLAGAAMDDGASALAPGPSLWGGSEAPPLLGDAPVSVGLDR